MALHITPDNKFKKLIIIGDRLLIRPARANERTDSGLYLPCLLSGLSNIAPIFVLNG